MPIFPDSPTSPSLSKFAVYFLGIPFVGCAYNAYAKFFPTPIENVAQSPDIKSGIGLTILAAILAYGVYRFANWTDNSEY